MYIVYNGDQDDEIQYSYGDIDYHFIEKVL